jgi:Xaa-Pro dipeptidase
VPDYPEFLHEEFENRWERARAAMAAEHVDALLITSEANYRYLSGHPSQVWLNRFRPTFMVLPRDGEPALVTVASETSVARMSSFIRDIRSFVAFVEPGVKELAGVFAERGLARGTVGCELGVGQRLGMPVSDLQALERQVPGARFVDAGALLWRLRLIKSPAEIAYLRRANEINGQAVARILETAKAGWTERDVYRELATTVMSLGAERPGYIPVNADPHAPDSLTGGPTDRPLRTGKMVYIDTGCTYRGYWADVARVFAVGRASDHQHRMYRIAHRALQRSLEAVRPGAPVADIMRAALAELEAGGVLKYTGRLGRIGHGTGLDLTEPPSINLEDPTVMEVGMALNVEPNFVTEEGNFILEEDIVVTADGPALLSRPAAPELPVVG